MIAAMATLIVQLLQTFEPLWVAKKGYFLKTSLWKTLIYYHIYHNRLENNLQFLKISTRI